MIKSPVAPPPTIEIIHQPDNVVYKVWVAIERIATKWNGDELYEDIGLPDPIGMFDTLEEAREHLRSPPGWRSEHSDHV